MVQSIGNIAQEVGSQQLWRSWKVVLVSVACLLRVSGVQSQTELSAERCRKVVENYSQYTTRDSDFCRCLQSANSVNQTTAESEESDVFVAEIAGMLPLSNPPAFPAGEQVLWASYLALHHQNRYTADPIRLHLQLMDTGCSIKKTIEAFILNITQGNNLLGTIGPGCGNPGKVIGRFMPFLYMPMVAYSIEGEEIGKRKDFSTFYRLSPTSSSFGKAFVGLMKKVGWNSLVVLVGAETEFNDVSVLFQQLASTAGIELAMLRVLKLDESLDLHATYKEIRETRTRVILLASYLEIAQLTLCAAVKEGLTGSCCNGGGQYFWLYPDWYPERWFDVDYSSKFGGNYTCTREDMVRATAHSLSVQPRYYGYPDSRIDIADDYNMTVGEWGKLFSHTLDTCLSYPKPNVGYSALIYDSILLWMKTLQKLYALNGTQALKGLLDSNTNISFDERASNRWAAIVEMGWQNFNGVSGPVHFITTQDFDRTNTYLPRKYLDNASAVVPSGNRYTFSDLYMSDRNAVPRLVAIVNPYDTTVETFFNESITFGECCRQDSFPGSKIPLPTSDTTSDCSHFSGLSSAFGCSGALAFVVILSIVLPLLLFLSLIVYFRRTYQKELAETRAQLLTLTQMDDSAAVENGNQDVDDKWEVNREAVLVNRRLGEGNFGAVFGGEYTKTDGDGEIIAVAVKTLHGGATAEEKKQFIAEARLMTRFDHNNIVRLIGYCRQGEPLCVLMELMMYGDLKGYLLAHRHLCGTNDPSELYPSRLTYMVLQVAEGLEYLASLHFVHRDIAARNCMVTINYTVKIGDFGMARDTYMNDYYRINKEAPLPVRWMARESLLDGRFTTKSDMWSFGVVVWEVASFGALPFPGLSNGQVVEVVRSGSYPKKPGGCSAELHDFMRSCWEHDVNLRLTATQAIRLLRESPKLVHPCLLLSNTKRGNMLGTKITTQEVSPLPSRRETTGAPANAINADRVRSVRHRRYLHDEDSDDSDGIRHDSSEKQEMETLFTGRSSLSAHNSSSAKSYSLRQQSLRSEDDHA